MFKPLVAILKKHPVITWAVVWVLFLGLVILLGISVDGGRVTAREASLFRFINGLPNQLMYPMILVQYSGVLAAPAIVAAIAALYRKWTIALLLLLIMPVKLTTEHIMKATFQRERPKVYIPDAILRGDVQSSGLSFPSGHALIVFAIATFLTPFLPKKLRLALWAIAGLCILARIYLGAHLPRDVVAGAILGVMVGLLLLGLYRLVKKSGLLAQLESWLGR